MADEGNVTDQSQQQARQFEQQAAGPQTGLLAEFVYFLRYNKKWWLTPIVIVLLLVGILVWLSASGLPFIYPI
jgi:hypothetical protein